MEPHPFGFAAPRKAVLTVEEKAAKALKAKATRLARGIKSKKAKAGVTGSTASFSRVSLVYSPRPFPRRLARPS